MAHRPNRYGLTRDTADALATVRTAIEAGRLAVDPTAAIVLMDIEEAVRGYARNAAVVRIRQINAGTPPKERARRAKGAARETGGAKQGWSEWSVEELEALARLWRDSTVTLAEISEKIGRSHSAIKAKMQYLGLRHRPGERMMLRSAARANAAIERSGIDVEEYHRRRVLHERLTASRERRLAALRSERRSIEESFVRVEGTA